MAFINIHLEGQLIAYPVRRSCPRPRRLRGPSLSWWSGRSLESAGEHCQAASTTKARDVVPSHDVRSCAVGHGGKLSSAESIDEPLLQVQYFLAGCYQESHLWAAFIYLVLFILLLKNCEAFVIIECFVRKSLIAS